MTEAVPTRKYKHPPVAEAICEFVFAPGESWDPTIPGRLYELLRGEYEERPTVLQTMEAQLDGPEGLKVHLSQTADGVQFRNSRATKYVRIGPRGLSIHTTEQPYRGWEETFLPQIRHAARALSRTATDMRVNRIGIRYVNRMPGVKDAGQARVLVTTLPPPLDFVVPEPSQFMARVEHKREDGSKVLLTTAKTDLPEEALILDIDVIRDAIDPAITFEQALELLQDLKVAESGVFEAAITPEARSSFDVD